MGGHAHVSLRLGHPTALDLFVEVVSDLLLPAAQAGGETVLEHDFEPWSRDFGDASAHEASSQDSDALDLGLGLAEAVLLQLAARAKLEMIIRRRD